MATLLTFELAGVYKTVLRYSGQVLFSRVTGAVAIVAFCIFLSSRVEATQLFGMNVDTIVVFSAATILLVLGSRMLIVRYLLGPNRNAADGQAVAIYGAGAAGRQLFELLQRSAEYRPVLYLDDNPQLQNREIQGVKIVSPSDDKTSERFSDLGIAEIFLAMPSISHTDMQRVFNTVQRFSCGVRTCLLYTSPSPRDLSTSRMPSSA